MAVTTLKLAGQEFVILPKREYQTLKARATAQRNGARKRAGKKPSKEDVADLAEIERLKKEGGPNIPWEQVKRKLER